MQTATLDFMDMVGEGGRGWGVEVCRVGEVRERREIDSID